MIRFLLFSLLVAGSLTAASDRPVFQVGAPDPTADKPQSKIWYQEGSWWALLPDKWGPSLWERTGNGWQLYEETTQKLAGLPGRGDVWYDADGVTAVLVADRSLTVLRMTRKLGVWKTKVLARWAVLTQAPIETATIARDGKRRWWIAAPVSSQVMVWSSMDAAEWSTATVLAQGMSKDDICAVARLQDGVGVLWSDQKADAVYLRRHADGQPAGKWDAVETAESGNLTADDHINAALTPDGTLWVATKNSVDQVGKPQQVLRLRSADGKWRNIPYAVREETRQPSRPVVALSPDGKTVFFGHTIYHPGDHTKDEIVFGKADLQNPASLEAAQPVIAPQPGLKARINNVTRAKLPFPADAPWLVLASDQDGRVYEADLKTLK